MRGAGFQGLPCAGGGGCRPPFDFLCSSPHSGGARQPGRGGLVAGTLPGHVRDRGDPAQATADTGSCPARPPSCRPFSWMNQHPCVKRTPLSSLSQWLWTLPWVLQRALVGVRVRSHCPLRLAPRPVAKALLVFECAVVLWHGNLSRAYFVFFLPHLKSCLLGVWVSFGGSDV